MGLLTDAQRTAAQTWLRNTGFGNFNNQGQFQFTNPVDGTGGWYVAGAGQSLGYTPEMVSEALGGTYSPDAIRNFNNAYAPQISMARSVFEADQRRGGSQTPAQGSNPLYPGANPYIGAVSDDMTRRINQQLQLQLQGIRGEALGMGGLGGERQGVAEGIALRGGADALAGGLANLNFNAWDSSQNRALQQEGLRNNFYVQNRGLDLDQLRTGASIYGLGTQSEWDPVRNASSVYAPYATYGQTTGSAQQGGGGVGALGGAWAASTLYDNWNRPAGQRRPFGI